MSEASDASVTRVDFRAPSTKAGGEIRLRRATPDDAPAYVRIMGDPSVYPGLMQLPYPDAPKLRQWLTDSAGKPDLLLVAEVDGEVVGTAGLHPASVQLRRRHAMMLGISVPAVWQRQGIGRALMGGLVDYADRWGGILRIELTVYTDNLRAIALYRSFGFEVEGTHRAYALRDGAYVDVLAMARLHPHPPGLAAAMSVPEIAA